MRGFPQPTYLDLCQTQSDRVFAPSALALWSAKNHSWPLTQGTKLLYLDSWDSGVSNLWPQWGSVSVYQHKRLGLCRSSL